MAKAPTLEIEIKPQVSISEETAERMLKLLEWYCNEERRIITSALNMNKDIKLEFKSSQEYEKVVENFND